jgi:hypothetical protein
MGIVVFSGNCPLSVTTLLIDSFVSAGGNSFCSSYHIGNDLPMSGQIKHLTENLVIASVVLVAAMMQ